jgi:hypothetical protein
MMTERMVAWWNALPNGWAALLWIAIGRLAAGVVRLAAGWALDRLRFDDMGQRLGLTEFLRKGDVSYTPSRLAAMALYWMVLLASLLAAFHRLGVEVAVTMVRRVQAWVPSLIGSAGVALFGTLAVVFIAKVVRTIARNAAFPYAELLHRAIRWLGLIIVVFMALEQAGVDVRFVWDIGRILVAATAFGLALAFGLGCKDMARDALRRFLDSFREETRAGRSDLEG